ncbi:MAG: hypothetical protein Q7R76_02820 [Candidatus Woesearchaeota archaeon]|nr:hypothetical protein [Candidatus Woesearchaeota archaeon]
MASKRGKRRGTKKPAKRTTRHAAKKATKRTQKRVVKKPAKKSKSSPKKSKSTQTTPKQKIVGLVTHFYPHISVGIVEVKAPLKIGDSITISGHGKSFKQKITSMQIEHESIKTARKGDFIGIKTLRPVKEKDVVMK